MAPMQQDSYIFELIESNKLEQIWSSCTSLSEQMSYPSFFCTGDWLAAVSSVVEETNRQLVIVVTLCFLNQQMKCLDNLKMEALTL